MKKILFVIIIHILLLKNLQFIAWPENLTWPYLNSIGLSYYKDIFVLYPPFYWDLLSSFYKVFGISVINLQILSYLVIAISDYLLWRVTKKNWLIVALYVPLQIFFEGNGIWVDHLLVPVFLVAYHLLNLKKYFLLGLALGACLFIKQTGIYFILGTLLILIIQRVKFIKITEVVLGICVSLATLITYLYANNQLYYFWNDAVSYILLFHTKHPLQSQLPTLRQSIVVAILFLPPIIYLIKKGRIPLVLLILTASLGIFTRFEYFHFQPALPFLAIAFGEFSWLLIFYSVFFVLFIKFFISSWHQETRFFGQAIYDQSKIIRNYVNGRPSLFINTWDQYYFLSKTKPAGNFFVPSTPWTMDYPQNQEKLVSNLKKIKPEYIIYNNCFLVKYTCYQPKLVSVYISSNYLEVSKLADGTGIFKYDPMGVRQKIQTQK